jgi:hypothetical protein
LGHGTLERGDCADAVTVRGGDQPAPAGGGGERRCTVERLPARLQPVDKFRGSRISAQPNERLDFVGHESDRTRLPYAGGQQALAHGAQPFGRVVRPVVREIQQREC